MKQEGSPRAWLMLLGAMMLTCNTAINGTLVPLFFVPVARDFDIPRTLVLLYSTVFSVTMAFSLPVWSVLKRKTGLRKMLRISGAIAFCAYWILSRLDTIYPFYLCAAAVGFGAAGMSLLPATEVVSNWFVKKGTFVGLTIACTGVGGVILTPVINSLIQAHGWRAGFCGMALSSACVTFLPSLWLRTHPQELGLKPWGSREEENENSQDVFLRESSQAAPQIPAREVLSSRGFKILMALLFLTNACLVSVVALLATQHADLEYTDSQITFLVSFYSATLTFTKFGCGALSDVTGVMKAYIIAVLAGCAGVALLGYGVNYAIMLPAIVGMGVVSAINNVFPSLFTSSLYRHSEYAAIFSRLQSASMLGYACGFPVYGLVYDISGSYRPGYAAAILISVVCLFLLPQVKK